LEAYQSAIISALTIALTNSAYLRNEVVTNKSDSAKAIRQALAGNIILFDLIEQLKTPEEWRQALVGSIWYSNDGGVAGSKSILEIGEHEVRERVLDPETYERHTITWTYQFDAGSAEFVMTNKASSRRYRLRKLAGSNEYTLSSSTAETVGYHNEPDDCSA
jgi:hypothetical protein